QYFTYIGATPNETIGEFLALGPKFKAKHPDRSVFQLFCYADFCFQHNPHPDDAMDLIQDFVSDPPVWDEIPWGSDHDKDLANSKLDGVLRALDESGKVQTDVPGVTEVQGQYNSEKRRKMRARFHGKGALSANNITIDDPETGKTVVAEILGRHPLRKYWLALALPSLNVEFKTLSRGHYIDGKETRYQDAFNDYVNHGSNKTLSVAANKEQLDDCCPGQFELNLVLVMPWGKGYRYAAYGIPHYKTDRDFMVFSK
ncbi:hypothetical protein B0T10DRAFT_389990, partial [Thelonectria olida]